MKSVLVAFAALAMFAGCSKKEAPAAPVAPDENTVRMTAQGEVIGFVTPDGAHSWRGLPFAAPPVGDLRWRAPQQPAGWEGARIATEFGARCAQMSNRLNAQEKIEPGLLLGSEDCLYLDIYAPANSRLADAPGEKLPVMVWIHGGSNVWGRGSSYDGSRLAVHENVIIVPVQYRLGPFGFFSDPMLRADAQTPEDAAANFAILDLIASLRWVQENIGAFGGDPDNVTIFGESAGGHNVGALLASPLAKGLFQRAILQSGSFDSVPVTDAENANSKERNPSGAIVQKLGAQSAEALRGVSATRLLEAYGMGVEDRIEMPTVIADGVTVPAAGLRESLSSAETFNPVPIITGVNRDELKFFHAASQRLTKKFLGIFLVSRDKGFYDAVAEYPSRIWRIRSVDQPAAAIAAAGGAPVYAYRFDWDEGGRFGFSDLAHLLGAAHAIEIPFVFNRFQLLGDLDNVMFRKKTAASREKLSRAMGAYWANFARDGAPSAEGFPNWPAYSSAGGTLLRFDSNTDGGIEIMQNTDTLEKLTADLKADPRLNAEERCLVVEAIRFWLDGLAEEISADIGCAA
ncbi:carboxylesterase/lipase family protein [Hyphococcus sp.]|uniref:carboxylesterase/lipase family protein n=1 Tax=Hyphococcus sp. TaxID=2038636 RepID=UPI0020874875|nr:MAG: para-nitrobenzyl esterase [Marinicaulis sp.]